MIKIYNQVPSVYSNASRDFQYLCWLIDIVLNSVKHNIDDIYDLPNSKADARLTELLAMTLGFKVKRNYDQNQLRALVAALPHILRYKGTVTAVEMAGNALIAASGALGNGFSIDEEALMNGELKITLPVDLVDVSLFTDLLIYIIPAGMTYRIVRNYDAFITTTTPLSLTDSRLAAKWIPATDWTITDDKLEEEHTFPGLTNMFDAGKSEPVFANYKDFDIDNANIGLLINSIIPALTNDDVAKLPMLHTAFESVDTSDIHTLVIDKYTTEENEAGTTVISLD